MIRDPASYRDPAGHVFEHDGEIFRTITSAGNVNYQDIRKHPILRKLKEQDRLIDFKEVEQSTWPTGVPRDTQHLLHHQRIPIISYPYEWCFAALRAAALFHLNLHLDLLDADLTLSDASAYNIQFIGSSPIFIDFLSIRPYRDGEYWIAHEQFLRQFVNPLILEAQRDISFAPFYRSSIEGLDSSELASLLPAIARLNPRLLFNVFLPARLGRQNSIAVPTSKKRTKARPFTKASFVFLLKQLHNLISGLHAKKTKTTWSSYSHVNSYATDAKTEKHNFIRNFIEQTKPAVLIDIGCNDGEYSFLAHECGARCVVGFDQDRRALDRAFQTAHVAGLPLHSLHMDLANPSPRQGWRCQERRDIHDRIQGDAVIALAVVHHLAIGRNLPLKEIIEELMRFAPVGVVEFVPKDDPMVQVMLQNREDIFDDYNIDAFRMAISHQAKIIKENSLSGTNRRLIWYERQ